MNEAIFTTGATGFLGTQIIKELVSVTDKTIYVLIRSKSKDEAISRLKQNYFFDLNLYSKIGRQIIPVLGDFTISNLGIKKEDYDLLKKEVGYIFHVGAEVGLRKSKEELNLINTTGTKNVLSFAKDLDNLKKFNYVSTAYVAGSLKGEILEEPLNDHDFSSYYEQSKYLAEKEVINSKLPYMIFRPGMIIGDSKSGRVKNFNTVYYILKQLLTSNVYLIPTSKDARLNVVPVDYVASSITKLGLNTDVENKILHLTSSENLQPKVGELLDYLVLWADKNLNLKVHKPVFINLPFLKNIGVSFNLKNDVDNKSKLSNMVSLLPYFYDDKQFDRSIANELLGEYSLNWKEYIDKILTYATSKNFMHQSERNVFEQAIFRRESKSFPINYYDVKSNEIVKLEGKEVNKKIEIVKKALLTHGLKKGDKIALTGINSIDYMVLDHAIGLIGATSVPIYYTTPIEEANLLLDRSGANWFFVGDERIMKNIDKIDERVKVVAFSNGENISNDKVMAFEKFLEGGEFEVVESKPDPDDLATIRYTSGTTGEPKGVMFNFHQLKWMGEVLTNLLSWKGRNREMRYLSFLPESHVVEGILASYAPYYMLAKVDFYFLNDFGSLVDNLPKVRPTVFFSVPRFYEKLWDQLAANKIGKKYLQMKDGTLKNILGFILKKVILKKAGLDCCEQLIVGSAPISEALLLNFRKLGIEVYNAYGQTEAPLITINRFKDNVIPSIGTPLPETKVEVMDDGELIVKGPQVCLGYYGLETDSIKNGVLKTGDLGSVDETGHITLFGRKKEMIITAYGKNISTPKIEERLKNIPCVSEAVLIGENRPYCTALLWTDGDISDLDKKIEEMNSDLSHPEQIRKYTIIKEALSIQKGELTPNLKVKRKNVEAHYQKEIEEMYK